MSCSDANTISSARYSSSGRGLPKDAFLAPSESRRMARSTRL